MDEYRGRYEAYGRREAYPHPYDQQEPPEPPPPLLEPDPPAPRGLLGNFGIGGDLLDEYLPILLILLGAVGVYLWLGKQGGGLGGLLGGFLK